MKNQYTYIDSTKRISMLKLKTHSFILYKMS